MVLVGAIIDWFAGQGAGRLVNDSLCISPCRISYVIMSVHTTCGSAVAFCIDRVCCRAVLQQYSRLGCMNASITTGRIVGYAYAQQAKLPTTCNMLPYLDDGQRGLCRTVGSSDSPIVHGWQAFLTIEALWPSAVPPDRLKTDDEQLPSSASGPFFQKD
ncbi:hypothetical protein ANO14919_119370 [Xylariales sp. No.14919]|nr:hypothetical protein ANO14919_119370 [Xylariales sp. No.14919]